jgi:hypothetical protein
MSGRVGAKIRRMRIAEVMAPAVSERMFAVEIIVAATPAEAIIAARVLAKTIIQEAGTAVPVTAPGIATTAADGSPVPKRCRDHSVRTGPLRRSSIVPIANSSRHGKSAIRRRGIAGHRQQRRSDMKGIGGRLRMSRRSNISSPGIVDGRGTATGSSGWCRRRFR